MTHLCFASKGSLSHHVWLFNQPYLSVFLREYSQLVSRQAFEVCFHVKYVFSGLPPSRLVHRHVREPISTRAFFFPSAISPPKSSPSAPSSLSAKNFLCQLFSSCAQSGSPASLPSQSRLRASSARIVGISCWPRSMIPIDFSLAAPPLANQPE